MAISSIPRSRRAAARRDRGIEDIAIVRIEQMYPFPRFDLQAVLARYPNLEDAVWVQEEPKNQGSWYAMQSRMAIRLCIAYQEPWFFGSS